MPQMTPTVSGFWFQEIGECHNGLFEDLILQDVVPNPASTIWFQPWESTSLSPDSPERTIHGGDMILLDLRFNLSGPAVQPGTLHYVQPLASPLLPQEELTSALHISHMDHIIFRPTGVSRSSWAGAYLPPQCMVHFPTFLTSYKDQQSQLFSMVLFSLHVCQRLVVPLLCVFDLP